MSTREIAKKIKLVIEAIDNDLHDEFSIAEHFQKIFRTESDKLDPLWFVYYLAFGGYNEELEQWCDEQLSNDLSDESNFNLQ